MADWCLLQPIVKVGFGSSDDIRTWRNVPNMVIVNVPKTMTFGEKELLEFLEREKLDGLILEIIQGGAMRTTPPTRILIKLGDTLPDEAMRYHFTREEFERRNIYDWRGGNQDYESGLLRCKTFYKKYSILTIKEYQKKFGTDNM